MKLWEVLSILICLVTDKLSRAFIHSCRIYRRICRFRQRPGAKWNFGARGEDDIEGEFYNKGFTFDLFDAQSVEPMDFGEKSFTFTGAVPMWRFSTMWK